MRLRRVHVLPGMRERKVLKAKQHNTTHHNTTQYNTIDARTRTESVGAVVSGLEGDMRKATSWLLCCPFTLQ